MRQLVCHLDAKGAVEMESVFFKDFDGVPGLKYFARGSRVGDLKCLNHRVQDSPRMITNH